MSVREAKSKPYSATDSFNEASSRRTKKKRAPPFSLRLSDAERAELETQAGGQSLGGYIRERLLGDEAAPRRKTRRPHIDDQKIARVLADLGASRLASNINQLAKAANMGTLDVSRNVEQELLEACTAIREMRDLLMSALGLRPETE